MRTRRSLLLAAVVAGLLVALAGPAVAASAATPAAGPIWTLEKTPVVGTSSELNAVRCAAASSCIGVGYYGAAGTSDALAESWNGATWSQLTVPQPSGARMSQLTGLSCLSAAWCTAVGFYENSALANVTLAEFWNGKTWTIETTPNPTIGKLAELTAVSCPSTSNCTAVGYWENTSTTAMTLAEHWNGATWTGVGPPDPAGAKGSQLHSVSCATTSSCYAVGNYTNNGNVEVVLAESWNGATWSLQAASPPSGSEASAFASVSCTTASDCTAVGDSINTTEMTLAEAWNGHTWSVEGTPAISGSVAAVLNAISCAASDACTAVGWYVTAKHVSLTLAESWDPKGWAVEGTTNTAGATENFFNGVACAASVFCTAVGQVTASTHASLAEQWVGGRVTSSTALTSSANPAVVGQPTTFTATVSSSGGAGAVSGTVAFTTAGATLSCNGGSNVVAVSGGRATCVLAHGIPTSANHVVTAAYSGSPLVVSSSASVTETVARDRSGTGLVSDANPSVTGEPLTFTATVFAVSPGSGTPTGDIEFTFDGAALPCNGTASGTVALSGGHAVCAAAGPVAATSAYGFYAAYSGDPNFIGSNGAWGQSIEPGSTATTLVSSANPSSSGESVTFTATVPALSPATGTPAGTVTFAVNSANNAVSCTGGDTATLSGGVATCTVNGLLASQGPYTATATYNGGSAFHGSASSPLSQAVGAGSSATSVTASANPSVTGEPVMYTATVATLGAPTGTVTFTGNGAALSCNGNGGDVVTLSGGTASCSVAGRTPTSVVVLATYSGDANFDPSEGTLSETVDPDASTVTVRSSVNPSVAGQAVSFTATVGAAGPGAGTPTGNVTFTLNGAALACNGNGGDVVALSGGQATCAAAGPGASAAAYQVRAAYAGDANFTAATGSVAQTVGQGTSTTTLRSSANPSASGQAVTLTATVAAVSPATGTPSGTVTFGVTSAKGTSVTCTGGNTATLAGGAATCAVAGLLQSAGPYTVTAAYSGDTNFKTSTATPLSQAVGAGTSTTSVASSANPAVTGQPVTFTATVTATGTPTGSVTFTHGGVAFACNGTGSDAVTLSAGKASCTIAGQAPSSLAVLATYGGDANFSGSSGSLTETVNKDAAVVTVTSGTNPSVTGQALTFTATVTAATPGAGSPSGTVTFTIAGGGLNCNTGGTSTVTLNAGVATCATFGETAVGSPYSVVASYSGDTNFLAATGTVSQTVGLANTTTALASSANPSTSGESVTFTAHVTASAPASGIPTGSVTFGIANSAGAPLTCNGGNTQALVKTFASCTVAGMVQTGSPYTVTATYGGDSNFRGSTATPLSQGVGTGATSTTVTANSNPAVTGQTLTFTATVTSAGGAPTGTVTFTVNGTGLACSGGGDVVTLSSGAASCTVAGVPPAAFTVLATYSGDANFTGSSGSLAETVQQDGVNVVVTSNANPSVYSQTIGFTATVSAAAPGEGTPTGTVSFTVNGQQQCDDGTNTFTLTNGQATCPIEFNMAPGTYTVVATYSGDSNFLTGSNAAAPFTQTVTVDSTSVALTPSSTTPRAGARVIYTAVVTPNAPGTSFTDPQGTVSFVATSTVDGTVDLDCNGTTSDSVTLAQNSNLQSEADCTAPMETSGTWTVTATYSGSADFTASSASVTEDVGLPGIPVRSLPSLDSRLAQLGYRRFVLAV